jgi:hypothetical protein
MDISGSDSFTWAIYQIVLFSLTNFYSRAIESMFDLVKRYSHRSRKIDLNLDEYSFTKLKQVGQAFIIIYFQYE